MHGLAGGTLAPIVPVTMVNWNPRREWPSAFGLEMAEMMESGLPVLDRYRLSHACEGPSVISALLGGPIVLVEHHKAVEKGIELLSGAAHVVNSLGDVRWCGTEAMLRSNYQTCQQNHQIPAHRREPMSLPGRWRWCDRPWVCDARKEPKRASHIDPPASSYAIMRRARSYRGENNGPGKDIHGEL